MAKRKAGDKTDEKKGTGNATLDDVVRLGNATQKKKRDKGGKVPASILGTRNAPIKNKPKPRLRKDGTLDRRSNSLARNSVKFDWPMIQMEYIRGTVSEDGVHRRFLTLKELAEKHGASVHSVNRASKDGNSIVDGGWAQKREEFHRKISEEAKRRAVESYGKELAEQERRHHVGMKAAEAAAMHMMYEHNSDGSMIFPPRFRDGMKAQEVRCYFDIYLKAAEMQRVIVGQPIDRIEISHEREEPAMLKHLTADDLERFGNEMSQLITVKRRQGMLPRGDE